MHQQTKLSKYNQVDAQSQTPTGKHQTMHRKSGLLSQTELRTNLFAQPSQILKIEDPAYPGLWRESTVVTRADSQYNAAVRIVLPADDAINHSKVNAKVNAMKSPRHLSYLQTLYDKHQLQAYTGQSEKISRSLDKYSDDQLKLSPMRNSYNPYNTHRPRQAPLLHSSPVNPSKRFRRERFNSHEKQPQQDFLLELIDSLSKEDSCDLTASIHSAWFSIYERFMDSL